MITWWRKQTRKYSPHLISSSKNLTWRGAVNSSSWTEYFIYLGVPVRATLMVCVEQHWSQQQLPSCAKPFPISMRLWPLSSPCVHSQQTHTHCWVNLPALLSQPIQPPQPMQAVYLWFLKEELPEESHTCSKLSTCKVEKKPSKKCHLSMERGRLTFLLFCTR